MNRPAWDELYEILHETAEILNQDDVLSRDTLEQRIEAFQGQCAIDEVHRLALGYFLRANNGQLALDSWVL